MWNYLQNPKYISSISAGSPLRFEWADYITYGDRFENVDSWSKLVLSTAHVKNGTYSALWYAHY